MNINNNGNLERPADNEIFEISTIYLGCILIAVIMIAVLVDPLSRWVFLHWILIKKNRLVITILLSSSRNWEK